MNQRHAILCVSVIKFYGLHIILSFSPISITTSLEVQYAHIMVDLIHRLLGWDNGKNRGCADCIGLGKNEWGEFSLNLVRVASNDLMEYRAMCHCFFCAENLPHLKQVVFVAPTYSFSIQSRFHCFLCCCYYSTDCPPLLKFSCFLSLCS